MPISPLFAPDMQILFANDALIFLQPSLVATPFHAYHYRFLYVLFSIVKIQLNSLSHLLWHPPVYKSTVSRSSDDVLTCVVSRRRTRWTCSCVGARRRSTSCCRSPATTEPGRDRSWRWCWPTWLDSRRRYGRPLVL